MDNTAIEAIAAMAAAQLAQREIGEHHDIAAVVIPKDYNLTNLEKFKSEPDHFRGVFSTNILEQYTGYVDKNATADSGVFINQDKMTATAIIDMGNHDLPKWGKHEASVTLKNTPAYDALLSLRDRKITQQDFIDFAEDWQEHIQFYYGDDVTIGHESFKETIKTLRKLKTSVTATSETEIGNFAANRSAMESIEVTAAGSQQPPTGFLFSTIPYDGFGPVSFDCQLRALPDAKEVFLKYRIGQLAQHQERLAEQFRDKIINSISVENISVFIGNMDYQS